MLKKRSKVVKTKIDVLDYHKEQLKEIEVELNRIQTKKHQLVLKTELYSKKLKLATLAVEDQQTIINSLETTAKATRILLKDPIRQHLSNILPEEIVYIIQGYNNMQICNCEMYVPKMMKCFIVAEEHRKEHRYSCKSCPIWKSSSVCWLDVQDEEIWQTLHDMLVLKSKQLKKELCYQGSIFFYETLRQYDIVWTQNSLCLKKNAFSVMQYFISR